MRVRSKNAHRSRSADVLRGRMGHLPRRHGRHGAHGLSNDEIAYALVLSPTTAKTHVSRAMIKLGARDRAQLVVFAYQTGLVAPRAAGL